MVSRDAVFRRLDEYCRGSYIQIGERHLKKPILKSYVFETARVPRAVESDFANLGDLVDVDDRLVELRDKKGPVAYLEDLGRFRILYTLLATTEIEPILGRMVRNSESLDTLWLSGEVFSVLFDNVNQAFSRWRFVRAAMGFNPIFEDYRDIIKDTPQDESDYGLFEWDLDDSPVSRLQTSNRLERLAPMLEKLGQTREFSNISMLRIPARTASGGHEFYYDGKVTNRSSDFFDHRSMVLSVIRLYEKMTEQIEDKAWLDVERGPSGLTQFRGSPIVIRFKDALPPAVFGRFRDLTFGRGKGPFRLWGNLLTRGNGCYHFYGLDLHLMNEVFVELTPARFVVFLPKETCGNTVHRLVTNIQKYLAPQVSVFVGDQPYRDIAREAFSEVGSEGPANPS